MRPLHSNGEPVPFSPTRRFWLHLSSKSLPLFPTPVTCVSVVANVLSARQMGRSVNACRGEEEGDGVMTMAQLCFFQNYRSL